MKPQLFILCSSGYFYITTKLINRLRNKSVRFSKKRNDPKIHRLERVFGQGFYFMCWKHSKVVKFYWGNVEIYDWTELLLFSQTNFLLEVRTIDFLHVVGIVIFVRWTVNFFVFCGANPPHSSSIPVTINNEPLSRAGNYP